METEVLSPNSKPSRWNPSPTPTPTPNNDTTNWNIQKSLAEAEKLASKARDAGTSPLPPPRQLLQYLVR